MDTVGVSGFDLRRFLSTESEQLIWKGEGLPSDDLSMENALVILQVSIWKQLFMLLETYSLMQWKYAVKIKSFYGQKHYHYIIIATFITAAY